jgi:hypothetical protein
MAPTATSVVIGPGGIPKKKPISYSNLLLGAGLCMFEYVSPTFIEIYVLILNRVTTLGQPFEVLKVR